MATNKETAKNVTTGTVVTLEGYAAWFKIGVQTFQLYEVETLEEAEWTEGCLITAFQNLEKFNSQ